ncbi:MAG: glycine--tRNA ligase subunit beta [Holophagaceae bacterium]|nr:glycine--tRNA ligase subunit beta [Holophagaceae bacterium]
MSDTRTFLLELHCEEIPARFLKPLQFDLIGGLLKELPAAEGDAYPVSPGLLVSPRKIAVHIQKVREMEPDQIETQVGPPQKMCVDAEGKATQTGLKFAEKWGVDFSAVRFEQPAGKKEPCAVVTLTKNGRPTIELLAEALPKLIASLHVPKAMRWGNSDFEFVRPIRNVLCLFGDEVVDFTVDGVRSSNTTWGHRLHHMQNPAPIVIDQPEDYEAALEKAGVVVSFEARRQRMEAQLHELAKAVDGRVVMDEELLNTLAEIVEFPMIVRGEFPREFLELPKEVLVTSLKEHQKSFCIEDAKGDLLPFFLAAANRMDDPAGFVKSGNEWVLKARLYDARFFFAEDRKAKLETRLDKLKNLTFQRDLGTYFEKTERIVRIAAEIAPKVGVDPEHAKEAARLSKADLRTLMVGEFPELQGIMGGEYLKREGAPAAVWQAVKEHYRPVGAEDGIPSTTEGCLLSLADKLDTVAGCFAVGIIPSGSKDPLALRRAGQGVTRILWEQGWPVDAMELARIALGVVGSKATKPEADTMAALESFFRDRVAFQLEQAGYAGPVRRSALPAGWSDLVDLKARCEALAAFADDPRFESLAQSAKRIGNILKDEIPSDAFDVAVLQQIEEKALAAHLASLESAPDHATLLAALAELSQPLEAFFTAVMVKCEDATLRAARLSLLHRQRQAFLRVADFSQWQ